MSNLQDLIQEFKTNLFERTTLSSNTLIFISDLTIHVNSHVENVSEFKVSHLETMNEEILKLQVCSTCCDLTKIRKPGSLSREEKFISALFSLVFLTKLNVATKQRNLLMFTRTREVLSRVNFLFKFNPMWKILFSQFFDYEKLHSLTVKKLYSEKHLMFDFFKLDSALLETFKEFTDSEKAAFSKISVVSEGTTYKINDILYENYTQGLGKNLPELILKCVKENEPKIYAKGAKAANLPPISNVDPVLDKLREVEIEAFLKDFNDFFEKTLVSYVNPEATYLMSNFERNLQSNDVFFANWLKNARFHKRDSLIDYNIYEHDEENIIFAPQVAYKDYSHFTFFEPLRKHFAHVYKGNYEFLQIPNDLTDSEIDTMLVLLDDGKLSLNEINTIVKAL